MTVTTNGTFGPLTYRRMIVALGLLAGVGLGVGTALDRPLIAVVIYAVGITAAVALPQIADRRLFDERDDTLHQRASGTTLALFGWLSAVVYPSLVVLSTTEHFAWGPATAAIAWLTVVVYGTYLLVFGYYRR